MIICMKILLLFALAIMASQATPALAQFDAASFTTPNVGVVLQPPFPRPGEEVTATVEDYRGTSYGATITWLINGVAIDEFYNQRTLEFTAGPLGVNQTIEAVLNSETTKREALSTIVRPSYLDIVIEPQTRSPEFYLGRSLPSIGSTVNATALISGEGFRNPDLVYSWVVNRRNIEGGAVRGRNQVSFEMPMGNSIILSLQVSDLQGNAVAGRSVLIPSVQPSIQFYEVSALFGINQNPVDESFTLIGNSAMVRAEPYNLDSKVYNNPDINQWKINDVLSNNTSQNPYEVTIQRLGATGSANLEFHVRDTSQVLQGAESNIQINF